MIPKFERVPDKAYEVARKVTADVFTSAGAALMNAKKFPVYQFECKKHV